MPTSEDHEAETYANQIDEKTALKRNKEIEDAIKSELKNAETQLVTRLLLLGSFFSVIIAVYRG